MPTCRILGPVIKNQGRGTMTYYRKQRLESFKKAMFASRFSDRYLKPGLPQPRAANPMAAVAPRPQLAS